VLPRSKRATQISDGHDPGLRTLQSPGVSGNFTPEQAMGQLLAGLRCARRSTAATVTLAVRGVNEFVEVSGSVPRNLSRRSIRDEIRDVAQEIVVIPQNVFEEQSATTLRDVLRNTPGITMSIGEAPAAPVSFGDNVFIRGFNVRNDIYIDGARDPGEVDARHVQRRIGGSGQGPTSVTGGRGSTGGSINMVTKAATLTDSASGRLTFGNADHKRGSFDVNRRLTDSVAFRVNAMWQDAGYPGRDIQKNKQWGFAPTIGLGIGKPDDGHGVVLAPPAEQHADLGIPTLFPDNAIAAGSPSTTSTSRTTTASRRATTRTRRRTSSPAS
jgi:catecholate siderophore receptor